MSGLHVDSLASTRDAHPKFRALVDELSQRGRARQAARKSVAEAELALKTAKTEHFRLHAAYVALAAVAERAHMMFAEKSYACIVEEIQRSTADNGGSEEQAARDLREAQAAAALWHTLAGADAAERVAVPAVPQSRGGKNAADQTDLELVADATAPSEDTKASVAAAKLLGFANLVGDSRTVLGLTADDIIRGQQVHFAKVCKNTSLSDVTNIRRLVERPLQLELAREYATAAAILLDPGEHSVRALDDSTRELNVSTWLSTPPLQQQADRLIQLRRADDAATAAAEVASSNAEWQRFATLCRSHDVAEFVVRDIKLKQQADADSLSVKYHNQLLQTISLKQKVTEQQILAETYSRETIPALQKIDNHVRRLQEDTITELRAISERIAAYRSLGEEFQELARAYAQANQDLEHRRNLLAQLC